MRPVRFLLNDELRELQNVDPTMTVLQWLRRDAELRGTKEGCAEGDCGACTVVIGRRAADGRMIYRAVNACILFVPVLDGCQLLTVEHLKTADGRLHPAQQAMVDYHGSQCGFCTPGFVMSLFGLYLNEDRPSRQRINDVLAGNLCRCTGYRPIIDAARAMYDYEWDDPTLAATARTAERLAALHEDAEPLELQYGKRRYFAPTNAGQLESLLTRYPEATLLAGGTDIGLWVTKLHRDLSQVIFIGHVAELHGIEDNADELIIGAAVTHADALETVGRHFPDFGELLRRFASTLIRNSSTVGGNVANGSPIGDSMPVMIALGARVVLRGADGRREIPLEDLYVDYGKQSRRAGEYVERLRIPKLAADERFRCYKLSKRFDQDISAVCAAFKIRVNDGRVTAIRTGFGGIAAIPARAPDTESVITGQPWTEATIARAEAVLAEEFTPLTDMRATERYRRMTTVRLLRKFFIETSQPGAKTRLLEEETWV
ncbi:xanthine dehydrogenase small subunit [Salinisphaera sp.]|uniref:xanthine dehydrogenase small subunit n=1 Tax=Salinisphaera sp. TaxID=1914330 RepID=UPI002D76D9B8|nr:xanthine dehydrogenase small subunit [Salinisphaera sp.]HET7313604.1 xanthine dehydrogenase small subunit [Salinisphaera sp.]